jgi:hypothetical protein
MADRLDALTVRESNGKSYWTKIGAAFPNRNGPGYIVRLDAMPASVDGQFSIHLREPKPRDDQSRSNRASDRDMGISGWDEDGSPF